MTFALFLLQASTAPANPLLQFVPVIAIFGIFYFLIIRPMQKQKADQQNMQASLQAGNLVQTNGGIVGTIVSLGETTAVIRVKPDNVKLQVARNAISGLAPDEKPQ